MVRRLRQQSGVQLRGSARRSSAKRPNYAEAGLSDGPEQSGGSSQHGAETSDSAAEATQPTAARYTSVCKLCFTGLMPCLHGFLSCVMTTK